MYGGADNRFVERLKIGLLVEDDIGGIFDLHEAPMVTGREASMYWAIAFGPLIQPFVQLFGIQSVGQALGALGVIDVFTTGHFLANHNNGIIA